MSDVADGDGIGSAVNVEIEAEIEEMLVIRRADTGLAIDAAEASWPAGR